MPRNTKSKGKSSGVTIIPNFFTVEEMNNMKATGMARNLENGNMVVQSFFGEPREYAYYSSPTDPGYRFIGNVDEEARAALDADNQAAAATEDALIGINSDSGGTGADTKAYLNKLKVAGQAAGGAIVGAVGKELLKKAGSAVYNAVANYPWRDVGEQLLVVGAQAVPPLLTDPVAQAVISASAVTTGALAAYRLNQHKNKLKEEKERLLQENIYPRLPPADNPPNKWNDEDDNIPVPVPVINGPPPILPPPNAPDIDDLPDFVPGRKRSRVFFCLFFRFKN